MTGSPGVDARLVAALERLAQAVRVLQWDAAQPWGLSPAQLGILTLLADPGARAGDRSVGGLARLFDLSAPTVSDAVAALRRKGLVQATAAGPGRAGTAAAAGVDPRRLPAGPGGRRLGRAAARRP